MIKIHQNLLSFIKPDDHAKFSPSSADRWLSCAYSVKASEDIVDEESEYAKEGTVAHEVCEAVFRKNELGLSIPIDLTFKMMEYKDNGDEMMESAEAFYEVCSYWMNNKALVGDLIWFGQERSVPIFPEKSCYGTGDFVIVGTRAAVIIDFKYGRKPVKAESDQLKCYAAGIARHLDNIPQDYKFYAVVFQPRISHDVKEACYSVQDMFNYLGFIWNAIEKAERNDNEPIEGSHCFWCPARRTMDFDKRCTLIKEKPLKIAQENFSQFLADSGLVPNTDTNLAKRDAAIVKLMTLYPAIKAIVEQAEEDFKFRIENGESIEGIHLATEYGRREINAESEAEAARLIRASYPHVEPMKTVTRTKLKSLKELEKEIGIKNAMTQFCKQKVIKKVEVLDERQKQILDSMKEFSQSISRS